jgi:hypothetical protein
VNLAPPAVAGSPDFSERFDVTRQSPTFGVFLRSRQDGPIQACLPRAPIEGQLARFDQVEHEEPARSQRAPRAVEEALKSRLGVIGRSVVRECFAEGEDRVTAFEHYVVRRRPVESSRGRRSPREVEQRAGRVYRQGFEPSLHQGSGAHPGAAAHVDDSPRTPGS